MTNYRIRKTSTGEYVYRDKYLNEAYKTYTKRIKKLESNGTAVEKLNKKEFKEAMNIELDAKITGIQEQKYSNMSSTEVIVKKSVILGSKRTQNKVKKLGKKLNQNIDLNTFHGKTAQNIVASWLGAGLFTNSDAVDNYLY